MNHVDNPIWKPATLNDQDSHTLATGEACVDTEKRHAEFSPCRKEDEDMLRERASILQTTDGDTYAILGIRRCEATRLGPHAEHVHLDIGTV